MKFSAKRDPPASTVGVFFAPNFIQNFYTVLKKRLWESRSTPTLAPPDYNGQFYPVAAVGSGFSRWLQSKRPAAAQIYNATMILRAFEYTFWLKITYIFHFPL
jgi:hypothetical protein